MINHKLMKIFSFWKWVKHLVWIVVKLINWDSCLRIRSKKLLLISRKLTYKIKELPRPKLMLNLEKHGMKHRLQHLKVIWIKVDRLQSQQKSQYWSFKIRLLARIVKDSKIYPQSTMKLSVRLILTIKPREKNHLV